jgi:cyclophilin family peptidyl-prolyl cis-trans isomerase
MAKRKHVAQRSRINEGAQRPGFTRRSNLPPPSDRGIAWWVWLALGVGAIAIVVVIAYAAGFIGKPSATPLAGPAGNGTTATIQTDLGTVTFEIYTESAPIAANNFIDLAESGFYNGIGFHRLVPDFMIQGGDPDGDGTGGPGYTIQDEPFVGEYNRGIVAMARTSAPNSQGSQFFIVVKDSPFLEGGGYTIFGNVTAGMDVVDQIVNMPTANDDPGGVGGTALDPVIMRSVTIQRP